MKKLGKSLSFFTKIMLVVGLLISNLSSLSIVFAAETTIDINVVEDKLNIEYLDELADEVKKVKVNVYENYTYLDGTNYIDEVTSLEGKVSSYVISFNELEETVEDETETNEEVVIENTEVETTTEDTNVENVVEEGNAEDVSKGSNEETVVTQGDEVLGDEAGSLDETTNDKEISLVVDSILSDVVFDGQYDVRVEIIDITDESNVSKIDSRIYSMEVLHESGLELTVVDANTNEELVLNDGRYAIDYTSPKVRVVAKLLAGGLNPKDMFIYNQNDYYAEDLIKEAFTSEIDFSGRLYGEYTIPVAVELEKYNRDTNEYELVEFSEEDLKLDVLYGEYELNTLAMNFATEELVLNDSYEFFGNTKDGVVYVLLNENKNNTMLDLYNIANYMFNGDEYITFDLSNDEYQNIVSTYDETTATMSLNDMLAGIDLDDSVVLSLINDGLTVTYKVIVAGDINNDNALTHDDLDVMINQVLGNEDDDVERSDLYDKNGEVNILDVIYLDQVIRTGDWNTIITEENISIDSELKVVESDIISGQKFTVEHIVKLSDYAINGVAGLFTYDDSALQLESIEVVNEWSGNNNDDQFLYVGEDSLELPVIEDAEDEVVDSENTENEGNVNDDTNVDLEDGTTEEKVEENEITEVVTEDYVVVRAVFTALKSGTHTINLENAEYFNENVYYGVSEEVVEVEVVVNTSDNNNLSSLTVAGQNIVLIDGQLAYEITVGNDVTVVDVEAMVENVAANITSIVAPEELVEGENIVTVTVTAENGDVKVYTIKVIREESTEEETTTQVNNNYQDYTDNNEEEDDNVVVTEPEEDDEDDDDKKVEEESDLSRIVIIILILLVIAGLIYLIFKDDEDEETKTTNREINKLRKEEKELEVEKEVKTDNKKTNNSNKNNNNRNSNNRKKDR